MLIPVLQFREHHNAKITLCSFRCLTRTSFSGIPARTYYHCKTNFQRRRRRRLRPLIPVYGAEDTAALDCGSSGHPCSPSPIVHHQSRGETSVVFPPLPSYSTTGEEAQAVVVVLATPKIPPPLSFLLLGILLLLCALLGCGNHQK